MEYEKPIQATSFSKKLSNGGLMASSKSHPYDGVFVNGGRSGKLRSSGAVVDGSDYAEIFRAGSTACSIPVLDIPELFDQGTSTSGGGRSSRPVDYSKIFAGLGDSADFAVPFEELLPPKKPNIISKGASTRTSAETRTRSRSRSRQLSFSEEKLEPSLRSPEQLLSAVEEFNVLHNRTGPGSQNAESRTVREAERSVFDDARVGDSVQELPRIPKLSRRAVSGPQPRVDVCDASQRHVGSRRRSSRSGSMSNDMFDAFDNGIGAHSSGMPSPSSTASKAHNYAGASRSNMPEREQSNCSPSFSDDEVDGNSIAAASAAAVRKAIEEAQARIKLAKELMERKKEGRVNFAKMNSGKGFKADNKVARTVEVLNTSREKGEQTSTFIARMSNHGQRIAGQVSPDFTDKKEFSTAQASGGLHEKESLSCPLGETAEAYGNERGGIGGSQSDSAVKRDSEGTEVTRENTEQGKITREIETVPGIFQWKFDANSFKSAQELEHEEEHDLEVRSVHDLVGEADQATNLADEHEPEEEELESKLEEFEVDEGNGTKDMLESQGDNQNMPEMGEAIGGAETIDHETEGCSRNLEEGNDTKDMLESQGDNQNMQEKGEAIGGAETIYHETEGCSRNLEEGNDTKDMLESQGDNQNMPEMGEAIGGAETIDHETERCSRNLEDTGLDEVLVIQNNELRLDETNLLHGKPRELESTEFQDHREECSSPGADEYRESNGLWELDNDMKYVEICDEHVIELRFNDLHGKEESNRGEGEDFVSHHDKDTFSMGEQILDTDHQIDMRESQLEGSSEADRKHSPTRMSTGGKEDMEVPQQTSMNEDGEHVDSDDRYNQDEIENFRETEEGGWYEETLEGVSVTAERMESPEDANGTEESDKECEGSEDANGTVEDGFDAVPHAQVFTNLEHTMQGSESLDTMNNTESAAETDLWSQQKQDEGLLNVHDHVTHVEEVVCESDESDGDIDDSDVGHNEEVDESDIVSEEMIEPQTTCVLPERTVEEFQETVKSSVVEENNVTDEYDIASTHGEDERVSIHGEEDNASQSSHDEGHIGNQMHVETFEQPSSSEGVVRMMEVKFQSSENKGESPHKAERKEEVASQSEAWIQNIRNLEKDELKEKARQRIVVDRAIKEARERAFAEARERAERAAADKAAAQARQRETTEASKMPEKTPSEANVTADRAAKNAKLKAERAAVERATNEARERALEKALAEKDAAKARNQAAKTAAEKFSSVPRDDAAKYGNNRSYGHQQNSNVTSSSSRQPSSSHHAAPYPAEKSGVPNSVHESSYWSKATLEQHQRTAERAAKALAEKKMRDLLAQREQAERHRLAETLDADVKRWSNGKERNLRALLSTLQYILGSDSGWQPIPLTDLVSTAAVKKAYRKATLVVHPDKLQQRGASIQQKYTCEKVFDLLKEAWNKFSAEEK